MGRPKGSTNKKQNKEKIEEKDLNSKKTTRPKKSTQVKKESEIKSENNKNKIKKTLKEKPENETENKTKTKSKTQTKTKKEVIEEPITKEPTEERPMKPKKRRGWSTCVKCDEQFMTSEMHLLSSKKYCDKCFNEEKSEVDYYKKLCTYIYEDIYDKECNMPFITTQIRFLKDSNILGLENLTNRRILMTLKYAIELEKVDTSELDPQWGISNIVQNYFYQAKKFYDLKQKIKNQNKDLKTEDNIQVVYIKRSDLIEKQEQYEKEKVLNGAKDLLGEDEKEAIISHLKEFGTKENLGFKN